MSEVLQTHEAAIRLVIFGGVLAAVMLWEAGVPRRRIARGLRWLNNLGIVVLNTVVLRLVFPTAAAGVAVLAETRGWGLFHSVEAPAWFAFAVSVVVLDLAIYGQHVVFHAVPPLWRLHRMHHSDTGFDVTTGLRFHPIESVLSMAFKMGLVAALGAPAAAVVVFEVVLNATAMFNHANARLPLRLDAVLRWVLVTPDMHRVHHSTIPEETNSNYGFSVSWWDRLFRTYRAQPAQGHEGMTLGQEAFRDPGEARLDRLLLQPLRRG